MIQKREKEIAEAQRIQEKEDKAAEVEKLMSLVHHGGQVELSQPSAFQQYIDETSEGVKSAGKKKKRTVHKRTRIFKRKVKRSNGGQTEVLQDCKLEDMSNSSPNSSESEVSSVLSDIEELKEEVENILRPVNQTTIKAEPPEELKRKQTEPLKRQNRYSFTHILPKTPGIIFI